MAELSQILVGATNFTNTDTKNTAGSTDTSSKLFLIGATSQAANPQTYSQDTAYVGTDGCLYSGGSKVLTSHQSVANKDATLAWSTTSTIATIGSTNITVSLPANPNTDEKVLQTLSNTNADRRLLFSYSENDNDSTNKVYKSTYLRCNPDYGQLRCVNDKGTVDWEIMAAPASTFTADRVRLTLGNSTANSGSGGCRYGELFIYGGGSYRAAFKQPDITADRDFYFPDASGTIALSGGSIASGNTKAVSGDTVYSYLNSNYDFTTEVMADYNSTYVNDNMVRILKVGNLVVASGRFNVKTAKPAGQSYYLFSLPSPAGAIVPVCGCDGAIVNALGYITSNGSISTGYYNIFVAYTCQ